MEPGTGMGVMLARGGAIAAAALGDGGAEVIQGDLSDSSGIGSVVASGLGTLGLGTALAPWRDGTTHLVMSPLEFMQRLAALVPRPRLHLIRFHGVLAPNAKLRALVVPQEPEAPAQEAKPAECEVNCAHHRPVRLSWAKLLKRVLAAT